MSLGAYGDLAEWQGGGLQNRTHGFKSRSYLHPPLGSTQVF